jgi:hypothetical protein
MLERTASTINYGQSRDTDNIGHKTQNEDVQNKNLNTLKDKRMSNAHLPKKNSGDNKASFAADIYGLFNEEGSIDGTVSFPAISVIY